MDNQAAMDKMFAQLAKSARIDVFKTSLDTMQEALEVSRKIREDEKKATDRNNAAQQKMLSSFASGLERQLSVSTKGLLKAQAKVQKALRTGNEAEMKIAQAEASRLSSVVSDIMKRSRESAKEIESYNKALEKSNEIFTDDLRTRREKIEELGKAGYIAQEVMLGSVKSSVDALKEGVSSLENLTEGVTGKLTKFFHKRAASFDQKASSATDPGKAKGFMQMAKTFGGIAKTLAVVGGSITILVSLFSMAEGAVKDMNKEILNSVSYTDLMAVSGDDVQDKFKTLRNLFTDGSFLDYLGMTSDELVTLGGNLAQANLGMRALGGGKNGLELMQQAMVDIKAESLALGISLEDAVSRAENFAYEIGVSVKDGAFLRTMVNDFADIRDMAVQTGYSTANFYEKVKGLTNELDNMNLRTKEAGALFIRLARVVGPNGVSGLLSGTASLKGEDYLEQIKRQMLTDRKKTKGILEAEAQRSASSLLATFGENGAGMAMLQKAGLDIGSNQGLVASMQKMSTKDRQALLGDLAMSQDTAGLGIELAKAFDVARGSAKGASRTDRSRAFDSMGAGAGLAMQYARLETHLGGRNLSDMSDIQKKAMMEFTDLSKEQLEQFGRMQDTYKGQFRSAQDMASKGSLTEDEAKKLSAMGLGVKGGKLVTKDTGVEVKDIAGFILAQSESIDKTKESTLTQEELLSQNVVATVSLADRINKYLGEILMDISSGIMDMVNYFFGKSESKETKESKKKLESELDETLKMLREEAQQKRSDIGDLERRLKVEKDPKKKKALQDKLKTTREEEIRAMEAMSHVKRQARELRTTTYGTDKTKASVADLRKASSFRTLLQESDRGGKNLETDASAMVVEMFNEKFGTSFKTLHTLVESAEGKSGEGYEYLTGTDTAKGQLGVKIQRDIFNNLYDVEVPDMIGADGPTGYESAFTPLREETKRMTEYLKETTDSQKQKKEAVEQARAEAKDSTVKRAKEQDNTHLAEEIVKAEKRDKLRSLASNLGVQYGEDAGASTIAEKINNRGFGTEQLMGYGYSKAVLRELGIKVENVNDGLFTGGKMYRFDQKDDILAMKPGGAVSQLGGGTINATINVNGAGDPEAVGRVVMREMENLNKRMRGGAK